MDLEQYREAHGMTYAALASIIGACHASKARQYALGIQRPRPEQEERILRATKGRVTLIDMHKRRMAHLSESGRLKGQRFARAG